MMNLPASISKMREAMRGRAWAVSVITALVLGLSGCGGGGGGGGATTTAPVPSTPANVFAIPEQRSLTTADVQKVIAQAVNEAQARGQSGVIAVTDRVGNVLAVYKMTGASDTQLITPGPSSTSPRSLSSLTSLITNPFNGNFDAQGVPAPRPLAAIAKAITGAYLSSSGNAFSTRTASQIVQQHFPPSPATVGLESGPLFGVQFSSLPCSDLVQRYSAGAAPGAGPRRTPLGLSADPGGFPLYKDGIVVGGVGVSFDPDYTFDPNILDDDNSDEEYIAIAATAGFDAPDSIRADKISVDGTLLRYSDATAGGLKRDPATAPSFASLSASVGALVSVRGYYAEGSTPTILAGTAYGAEASGYRQATTSEYANRDVFVVSNGSGANRYPPIAGTDTGAVPQPLTAAEVRTVAEEAFGVMSSARAQIRRPLDSRAQVTISVVDTNGAVLAVVRSPDAPIFGTDVSLQKARTAMFFSGAFAAQDLLSTTYNPSLGLGAGTDPAVTTFVGQVRSFLGQPAALTGAVAFGARSIGNIARPYFPDGQVSTANGPLSRPITQWSVFSSGLQSALVYGNIIQHAAFVLGITPDTPARCTFLPTPTGVSSGGNRLQNGIQIFAGGVPIYRGNTLVGAIGVSGDGIDQDDMISFLGLYRAGVKLGTIANAPASIRADTVVPPNTGGTRLRYVSCPFAPFVDSSEQNACQGK